MAKALITILVVIVVSGLLVLFTWLAGGVGLFIGIFVVLAIGIRSLEYFNFGGVVLPPIVRTITFLMIVVGLGTIGFIAGGEKAVSLFHELQVKESGTSFPKTAEVYDFSHEKIGGETSHKIPFHKDKWVMVILPVGVNFRTDPKTEIEMVFNDGFKIVDKPGYQPDVGDNIRRSVFAIKGVNEAGELDIVLQPKG